VTVTASDRDGASATTTFTWTVVSGLGAGIAGPGQLAGPAPLSPGQLRER
jgi:hypothetical protein